MNTNEITVTYSEYINAAKKFESIDERTTYAAHKFLSFNRNSVINILLMCKIYYEMKQNEGMYKAFTSKIRINLENQSSQVRKYEVIGKNFDKLSQFAKVLPARWSTIYKLANVSQEMLQDLSDREFLHPNVTAEQIDVFLPKKMSSFVNTAAVRRLINRVEVRISKDLTEKQMNEVLATLEEMKNQRLIDFEIPVIIETIESANDDDVTPQLAA